MGVAARLHRGAPSSQAAGAALDGSAALRLHTLTRAAAVRVNVRIYVCLR